MLVAQNFIVSRKINRQRVFELDIQIGIRQSVFELKKIEKRIHARKTRQEQVAVPVNNERTLENRRKRRDVIIIRANQRRVFR